MTPLTSIRNVFGRPLVRSVAAACGLALALLFTYVALFTAALRDPQPEGIEVAVFAPAAQAQQLEAGLERSAPGVYDLESADSPESARQAVLDRGADGALVLTAGGARVLTASAGGTATADALGEGLTRAVADTGGPAQVQDLKPLPANDSRGMSSYFTTIGVLIGSLAAAVLMWLLAPRLGVFARMGALGVFGVLAGLITAVTTAGIVDTLDGAFWSVAGVTALLSLAISLPTAGLVRWLGAAGIGVSMMVMVVLGLSSSGGLLSPEFLPGFFEVVGPLLPPDAAREALRSVVYFDGHGTTDALGVLAIWVVVGASGLLAAAGIRREVQPAVPLAHARAAH